MAIVPLFKHRKQFIKVVGHRNTVYAFTNYQYFTADKVEIAELQKLAASGGCGIYVDPAHPTIDTDAATPMAQLEMSIKEKLLKQLIAEGRIVEPSTSDQSPGLEKITNTSDSTVNGNSAAEQLEKERLEAEAKERLAANPALAALEALKQTK